jgi:hypothetical protein
MTESSVRLASVPAEIQNGCIPNTSLQHHHLSFQGGVLTVKRKGNTMKRRHVKLNVVGKLKVTETRGT